MPCRSTAFGRALLPEHRRTPRTSRQRRPPPHPPGFPRRGDRAGRSLSALAPARPPPELRTAATPILGLVDMHVGRLLAATPAFSRIDRETQQEIRSNLSRIATYAAVCAHDIWRQSDRLGQ